MSVVVTTTERLVLREMTADDAEAVYRLHTNPAVMRFTGEPMPESLEAIRDATEQRIVPHYRAHDFGRWGVELRETGALIGWSGLKHLPELDEVDVGYRFFPDAWGHGYATESARAAVELGFERFGLSHVIGLVLPEHRASRRVLEKIGMHERDTIDYEGVRALRYVITRG